MIKSKFVRQHFGPILNDKEQFFKDCHLFIKLKKKSASELLDFLENEYKKNKEIINHFKIWISENTASGNKALRNEYEKIMNNLLDVYILNLEFKDSNNEFDKEFSSLIKENRFFLFIDFLDRFIIHFNDKIERKLVEQMNNMLYLSIPEFIQASKDLNKLIPDFYNIIDNWFETEKTKNLIETTLTIPNSLLSVFVPRNIFWFSYIRWQIHNKEEFKQFKDDFDSIYGKFIDQKKEYFSESITLEPENPIEYGETIVHRPIHLNENEEGSFYYENWEI